MTELSSKTDLYTKALFLPTERLVTYIDKVATVLMGTPVNGSVHIITREPGFMVDLGFEIKVVDQNITTIPTIHNLQIPPELSGKGYGSNIVAIWESSFPQSPFFGAQRTYNDRFWRKHGYLPYENTFYLKRV